MKNSIFFSTDLEQTLKDVPEKTKKAWKEIKVETYTELLDLCIKELNKSYPKLNIESWSFNNSIQVYNQSNKFFGLLKNEKNSIIAYVFIIPPNYCTRSGVLAQQVFPVLSGIIDKISQSKDFRISNRPIFVININEENLTPAIAVNIKSGQILGFNYIDIFNRDANAKLIEKNISPSVQKLEDYNTMVTNINKDNKNEIFKIDNNIITFQTTRLKDGIKVNNEPYWFVLKAYTALYLAINEKYTINMELINKLEKGNKTLDAFRNYVKKITE